MKKETYIVAMQKINPSEEFTQNTIMLLSSFSVQKDSVKKSNTISRHARSRSVLIFVKAAAVILALTMAATGVKVAADRYSINDLFKGFFKEPVHQQKTQQGGENKTRASITSVPLKEEKEYVEEASAVLYSTITANGLKLTARGVVGDNHNLYIAIDAETTDGSSITKDQQKDMKSITFSKAWMKTNGKALGQYCYITRADDGSVPGKATFVLNNSLDMKGEVEKVNHLSLTLTNLVRPNTEDIIDIGSFKNMQDLMDELGEAPAEDFHLMGVSSSNKEDRKWLQEIERKIKRELEESGLKLSEEGDTQEYFRKKSGMIEKAIEGKEGIQPEYFIRRSEKQAAFCSKYPDLTISNIGIRNQQLVMKFELNNSMNFDSFRDAGLVLVNRKTGEITMGAVGAGAPVDGDDESQTDIVDNQFISGSAQFGNVSKEMLKDCYIAFGGKGFSYETMLEGEWKLDFDVDYSDTAIEYDKSEAITLFGMERRLNQIAISPISINLQFADNLEKESNQEDVIKLSIILKDGSVINLEQYTVNEDVMNALLPMVIDPKEVQEVVINEVKLQL